MYLIEYTWYVFDCTIFYFKKNICLCIWWLFHGYACYVCIMLINYLRHHNVNCRLLIVTGSGI